MPPVENDTRDPTSLKLIAALSNVTSDGFPQEALDTVANHSSGSNPLGDRHSHKKGCGLCFRLC